MNKRAGFTLVEIMVVLVILAVMATLVVPQIIDRPDEARRTVAKQDILTISNALKLYKLDNYQYPSTQQGLAALVNKPQGTPEPKNWKSGGYLDQLPKDPWGNPYQYVSPGRNRTFDLFSQGADGKTGGEESNADITNWE